MKKTKFDPNVYNKVFTMKELVKEYKNFDQDYFFEKDFEIDKGYKDYKKYNLGYYLQNFKNSIKDNEALFPLHRNFNKVTVKELFKKINLVQNIEKFLQEDIPLEKLDLAGISKQFKSLYAKDLTKIQEPFLIFLKDRQAKSYLKDNLSQLEQIKKEKILFIYFLSVKEEDIEDTFKLLIKEQCGLALVKKCYDIYLNCTKNKISAPKDLGFLTSYLEKKTLEKTTIPTVQTLKKVIL